MMAGTPEDQLKKAEEAKQVEAAIAKAKADAEQAGGMEVDGDKM